MDWRSATKIRLLADFDGSFFNEREEFIAHRYSNTYFIFANCESLEDVNCKVLEWLSRAADKGIPYSQDWRNRKFQKFMLDGINMFLHTDFSKDDIWNESVVYNQKMQNDFLVGVFYPDVYDQFETIDYEKYGR